LSRVNKDRSSKPVLATMTDTVKDLGLRGLFKGTVRACVGGGGGPVRVRACVGVGGWVWVWVRESLL
jgi:hypothetical protein